MCDGENVNNYEDEEGGFHVDDIYIPPPPPPACTFDPTGPRLVISHIYNENFKSYAGTHVLGPLHKNFTSIIGPNGSGKSNVIDSMLFVFGYRAQKIRSKKICVLIHNSDEHPNLQKCKVSVHFVKIIDQGNDFTEVEGSHLVISRTAFRDNSSFYEINAKRSQFKDVAKLLRSYGVDLDHNRFLILQGEVEQISLMKPKAENVHDTGMLEFLEDVVGSVRYKEPLDKLSSRVDLLNEQRQEKLTKVKIVQQEKDELEKPRNDAIDYLKKENKLVYLNHLQFQFQQLECQKAMDDAEAKKKEIDDGITDLKEKLKEFSDHKKEMNDELDGYTKQYNHISKEKENLQEQFRIYDREDVDLSEEMKHRNTARKKAQAQLKKETENVENYTKAPGENAVKIEELTEHQDKLEQERSRTEVEIEKVMTTLRCETQELQDEKEKQETELAELQAVTKDAKAKMNLAESELEVYTNKQSRETAIYDNLKESYDKAFATIKERTSETKVLHEDIQVKERQLKKFQEEIQPIIKKEKNLENELRSYRVELQECRSSMQASSSNNRVLNAIMQQKNNIPGIIGRLGNLGAINEKYDVAISTACRALDNILVRTADAAQACINFLKKNNIGSATFIILDKQQDRWGEHCQRRINTPENVPRLFDLVRVKDNSFPPAFYFALRDTLVADNLDQATRIAYGPTRYRVVTLKGELIETSGTMSGGGGSKSVCRGRMGRSVQVSDEEIQQLQEKVDKCTKAYENAHSKRCEIEEKIPTLNNEIEKAKKMLKTYSMDVKSAENSIEPLEKQIKEQKLKVKAAAPNPQKVEELRACVEQLTCGYNDAKTESDCVEKTVKDLHNKIMQITEGKMKGLEKKRQNIAEKLRKITSEINKLTVATKTAERNLVKSKNLVEKHQNEVRDCENRMNAISDKKKEIEEKARNVVETKAKLEEEEAQVTEKGKKLKKQIETVSVEENELKKKKMDVDHEMAKFEQVAKENKQESNTIKHKMGKLKLNEIPKTEGDETTPPLELKLLSEEELEEFDKREIYTSRVTLSENLKAMRPNLGCIKEYDKKEQLYLDCVGELNEVTNHRDTVQKHKEDLRKRRLNEFMAGFSVITTKLKELYQMVTLGGDAELELVDSMDPFSEGIVFSVRPPKKSWKNISNLSGGEKTLSSLSLVFALHYYKTTPFYVMDEIDAALDFKNVSIVANYIKSCTKNAQFIIISLRTEMFELADRLVGIYKTHNVTKSVTIDPAAFVSEDTESETGRHEQAQEESPKR